MTAREHGAPDQPANDSDGSDSLTAEPARSPALAKGPSFEVIGGDTGSTVVLHVPHSSRVIPDWVRSGIVLDDDELVRELGAMTDAHTDLVADQVARCSRVRPWQFVNCTSRLVVDPERFPDEREEMAAVGMAAVYTKTSTGRSLRGADAARDERLLAEFFAPYSTALADQVDDRLTAVGRAVIFDLHSFTLRPQRYELHQDDARPDICLGEDRTHTPGWLMAAARSALSGFGDVRVNEPFGGTYVPLRHYETDHRVSSLMIEIRRDLFTRADASPDPDRIARLGAAIAEIVNEAERQG